MKRKLLCLAILVVGIFVITGCNDNKKVNEKKAKSNIKEVKKNKKQVKKKTSKNEKKKIVKKVETKKEEKKDTIVGSYEIIELKDDDETYDKKIIDSLNLDYSFEVKDDNTATMRFADQEENLTYDDKYFINEKEKIEYKYEKGKLVLSNEDTVLTFEKK